MERSLPEHGAPQAVIFDCDGVLVDSEAPAVAIDQIMLRDFGIDLPLDEIHARFVGMTEAAYIAELERMVGPLPPGWREPYRPLYEHALGDGLQAIEGVDAVIESLTVPTAVASNSSHPRIRRSLGRVGLLHHFDGRIVSAQDVPRGKPAPDVYLWAAALLQVSPEACVAIEDSPTGARAARSAGMRVFGYVDGLTSRQLLRAEGATTFTAMEELLDLIR
ncbi:HAD family hydrolase [Leifsonia sp. LS-T14]|uniref:HAD family hydrolase n=1 Tax=unclassified Leifsonia TaxID=2663824 RepID=UPI0035A6A08E